MRLPAGAPLGVASLFALTCTSSTEPAVTVSAIAPTRGFNDAPVDVVIAGGPFRPAYDIDTVGGSVVTQFGAFSGVLSPSNGLGASFALAGLTWLSTTELAAKVPAGIGQGTYDLLVRDPRGTPGTLANAFTSRGADTDAPAVSILEPANAAVVNVGAEVPVAFSADDDGGRIGSMTWIVTDATGTLGQGACRVEPGLSSATCRGVFNAPGLKQAEIVTVHVEARDGVGNIGGAESKVVIALPPVVSDVGPRSGPVAGGTDVVVTGGDFVAGTQVLVDGVLLEPDGGLFLGTNMIKGQTTPHEPGTVPVVVRSGGAQVAAGSFEFVGLPTVLVVSPATGPFAGNIAVIIGGRNFRDSKDGTKTKIEFGPHDGPRVALGCLEVVNANRITGVLPPGAGAVSVFASDPVGGGSELPFAFTYLGDEQADGGLAPPSCAKMGTPP